MKFQLKHKPLWIFLGIITLFLTILIFPKGYFTPNTVETVVVPFTPLLLNPELTNNHEYWSLTDWSSQRYYPTAATIQPTSDNAFLLSTSGYSDSFYAVGLSQGAGPSSLWTGTGLNIPITANHKYIVTWKGMMVKSITNLPISCLGMGINAWFDVTLQNGTLAPVETYIFFYQSGLYKLPTGSYNNFGYRQDFNTTDSQMSKPWLYMYFHPYQDTVGQYTTHSFELNQYIDLIKNQGEPYKSSTFTLTRLDNVLELFNAEGSFMVDYLGLVQT